MGRAAAVLLLGAILGTGAWHLLRRLPPGRPPAPVVRPLSQGVRIDQGDAVALRYHALRPPPITDAGPGPGVAARERPAAAPPHTDPVRFLLQTEEGEPVAGATARLYLLPGRLADHAYWPAQAVANWSSFLTATGEPLEAKSNEQGEVQFQGVPRMRRYRVDIASHGDLAQACYFGSTRNLRNPTIPLARKGGEATLEVVGLPPYEGQAEVILRRDHGRDLWAPVITSLWAQCVVPLSPDGHAEVPALPARALAADLFIPGVGIWRGLPVERRDGGALRVVLDSSPTMTLTGTLSGADGAGVAGAQLTLEVLPNLKRRPARAWLRPAVSDANGRFVFNDVPVGRVKEMHALAAGFVAPRLILEDAPLLPGETLDVPLQLAPGRSLAGVITDADGKPRAGVRVRPRSDTDMVFWDAAPAWTDDQGRYRIDGLPLGKCELTITDPAGAGEVELETEVTTAAITHAPTAMLVPTNRSASIRVHVMDASGNPVAGAGIGYRVKIDKTMSGTVHTGNTETDGSFRITGIQIGLQSIGVWAYKHGAASPLHPVVPAEAEAGTAEVRLVLPPVGRITGRVVQAGKPVAHITVAVKDTRLSAVTDESGRFRLRAVPVGDHDVHVRSGSGRTRGKPSSVRVEPGGKVDIEIELPPGDTSVRLRGRLVDGAGRPLAGVLVGTTRHWRFGTSVTVATAPDGTFSLPVTKRGDYPLYTGRRRLARQLSAGVEPVDVVFNAAAPAYVQGRILDEHGRQAYAMRVSTDLGNEPETRAPGGFFRMALPARTRGRLVIDSDYGFRDRLGRLQPFEVRPVYFKPGDTVVLVRRIPGAGRPPPSGIHLIGFVVDETGAPLPGTTISVGSKHDGTGSVTAESDGVFAVRNVPPGMLRVHVQGPLPYRRTEEPLEVAARDGPVRIIVPRIPSAELYTVRGRVVDADGEGVPEVSLCLEIEARASVREGRSGADGRFEFLHVTRGPAEVRVSPWQKGPGGRLLHGERARVEATPEKNDVILQLSVRTNPPAAAHTVEILLLDSEGELVPDSQPHIRLEGLGALEDTTHEPKRRPFQQRTTGRFRIDSVPAGRYWLHVQFSSFDSPYLPVQPREVEVPGAPFDVQLTRAAELHGRVEGENVEGTWMYLWTPDGSRCVGRTVSASGAFVFHVDPTQRFELRAHRPDCPLYGVVADATAGDSPHRMRLDKQGLDIAGQLQGYEVLPQEYRLSLEGQRYRSTLRMDEKGSFRVRGVPPGEYSIRFTNRDFDAQLDDAGAEATVKAGDTNVVLRRRNAK